MHFILMYIYVGLCQVLMGIWCCRKIAKMLHKCCFLYFQKEDEK